MKKKNSAIKLAQVHYAVITICGENIETDVFPFIQENWEKGHKLFEIMQNQQYDKYIPYVMENFTKIQIDKFYNELNGFCKMLMGIQI